MPANGAVSWSIPPLTHPTSPHTIRLHAESDVTNYRRWFQVALTATCRYDRLMPGMPADVAPESAVVLVNPDEDCSPGAFRAFLEEILSGPEPELESIDAVEALRALRVDAQA